MARQLPRYPIYVPSKGRADVCLTPDFLSNDGVPFRLVVEPAELPEYRAQFPDADILALPWDGASPARRAYTEALGIEDGGLIAARNWIKDHAIAEGYARHWQLDDNIEYVRRRLGNRRIICDAGPAFAAAEDFADRYTNVAIAGLNYQMFVRDDQPMPPFYRNARVYSCSLIFNAIPFRWRIRYNDDVDLCLQALAAGWCTLLINAFMIDKKWTMTVPGGNTADLYSGDGRRKMARSLERLWPGVVTTHRRFRRPQHVVKDAWTRFDTPLIRRPDFDPAAIPAVDERALKLVQLKPIRSRELAEKVAGRIVAARPVHPRTPIGPARRRRSARKLAGGPPPTVPHNPPSGPAPPAPPDP